MPSLAELQSALRADLLGARGPGVSSPASDLVLPAGLDPVRRIEIHRANIFGSLAAALAETFPVVRRLVSVSFFNAAAAAFIRGCPPLEPRLSRYGAGFPDHLGRYPPARQLTYLPDVARLEWAVNEAFHAADAAPLEPRLLAALAPEESGSLRLPLHPSCRLVESPYPVERIWHANQPDREAVGTIDLAEGGCRLLVHRRNLEISLKPLGRGAAALLGRLADGAPLRAAYSAAVALEPGFDLAGTLAGFLRADVFADLHPLARRVGASDDMAGANEKRPDPEARPSPAPHVLGSQAARTASRNRPTSLLSASPCRASSPDADSI